MKTYSKIRLQTPIDFEKLAAAYRAANWQWSTGETRHFPTEEELKKVMDDLLCRRHVGTGGLWSNEEDGGIVIYASRKLVEGLSKLDEQIGK